MLPINIYILTRVEKLSWLQKLEQQMSKRSYPLTIKKWEIQSLKSFSERLKKEMPTAIDFLFYYSFQIPKLGKEFDLLRISEDYVINIELKSRAVSKENIKKQLLQNRYYLSSLGKTVRSYTYVSSSATLLRLTNTGKLIESDWEKLCEDLKRQNNCYEAQIEELFQEENYLISPFTDIERFLNREYFLTFQQKDIKHHILKNINAKEALFQGFTGLPGTGKTLLLYDIALSLSTKQKVCVLHFGTFPAELEEMNSRLKRIDFYQYGKGELPPLDAYSAILIDEGHQMPATLIDILADNAMRRQKPIIFSYDMENAISLEERDYHITEDIKKLSGYVEYQLTNRIRMNRELSSFIHCVMNTKKYRRRNEYPSVSVSYAANQEEARDLLAIYMGKGYTYIRDEMLDKQEVTNKNYVKASVDICKEYEQVVMLMDASFTYDEEGFLRRMAAIDKTSAVRNLYHGLNRAKRGIALIVVDNETIFEAILSLLQK